MTTKRRDELLVGLLLLAAVVLGLGGTIWIARGGLARTYPLYARFPWGAGLKPGQPVLLAGVQVGYVDHVELIPDGTIAVVLEMQQAHQVPAGSTATVQANGIFGDMLIAITPVRGSSTYLPAGDTIPVGVGSPGTAELLAKGDAIATDVKALTGETRAQLVEGEQPQGVAHQHREPGTGDAGVPQTAQHQGEGRKAEVGLRFATAGGEEQQLDNLPLRPAVWSVGRHQARQVHQHKGQLEEAPGGGGGVGEIAQLIGFDLG